MKLLGVAVIALALGVQGTAGRSASYGLPKGRNGGTNCLICTAVVALVEQLVEFKNATVVDTLDGLCELLPPKVYLPCKEMIEYLGPSLIKLIVHYNGPDVVCHALNLCYTEPGLPTCRSITPPWDSNVVSFEMKVAKARALIRKDLRKFPKGLEICDIPGIKFICEWVNRSLSDRTPLIDFDKDGFSPSMTFRGSGWRGKDCSDIFSKIHPGALPLDHDLYVDSNCNGIYGINKKTKQAYEDDFCSQSKPRGVATLGDSISAHCSIPPNWFDATKISVEAFKPLAFVIENEADWPMLGSFTGFGQNNWTEVIEGPIDSIYKRMVARNRCNHRDYQNIAINGEDSFNVHEVMKTLSRDRTFDRPLMLFIVLVGNDVCQGKSGTLDNMTTPEQMYRNTLTTLDYLDKHIPAESTVMILGLADGRFLYENMHDRIHPVSNFWQDLTYQEFYDFLSCLHVNPCPAWLTSNSTARDRGAKRVEELNNVLNNLATKRKSHYSNFDLYYLDDPLSAVLKEWKEKGGETWELVEATDGFHSNTMGQALTSEAIWNYIEANMPEVLGPVNPHNEEIKKVFGDQGGL